MATRGIINEKWHKNNFCKESGITYQDESFFDKHAEIRKALIRNHLRLRM